MLLLGGALLITPGFITDAVGFALLLPGSRRWMANKVIQKGSLQSFTTVQGAGFAYTRSSYPGGATNPFQQRPGSNDDRTGLGGDTIEGESHRTDQQRLQPLTVSSPATGASSPQPESENALRPTLFIE